MKPSNIQVSIIESIIHVLETWKDTDDIDSPIHINQIEEILDEDLDEAINTKQRGCLENEINRLLYRIRKNR